MLLKFTLYTGLDQFGWSRQNGQLEIVWEAEENKEEVKDRLDYVLKGCKCKTGCNTKRCKCKKCGRTCGPGCQCLNCVNSHHGNDSWDEEVNQLEVEGQVDNETDEEYIEESDDEELPAIMYEDENINQIMASVFGEDTDDVT